MARVWVTGGTGFVGRQIVAALRRLGAEPVDGGAPRADLLDPAARLRAAHQAKADILVHAAWVTAHGAFWTAPENLDWAAATLDLLRRFADSGGRRVVLVGSCAEYDWDHPSRTPWRETRACRPATVYGASKLAVWIAAAAFARQAGLPAVNARLFLPVGAHEAPGRLLPSLIRAALTGIPLDTGPADVARDVIDVRDAGDAIARLALAQVQGPVNVGNGRGVSLGELSRLVGGGAPVARFGARPWRDGEPRWMAADPTLLRRATGFAPRYSLAETVADAMAYWRGVA